MEQKGYSLIELLATIVILSILSVTAIAGVNYIIKNSKEEKIKQQKNTLRMAGISYFQANKDKMPKDIGGTEEVYAYTLFDKKYLKEKIVNAKKESCMDNSYVEVHKTSKDDFEYKTYIYCGSEHKTTEDNSKPTVTIKFTDEKNNENAYQNVSRAKLIIEITGGISNKTSEPIPIEGYSFSISTKTDGINYVDSYNSGTIYGNNKDSITINKILREYIDITGVSDIRVTVNVTNIEGGKFTYTKSTEGGYNDTTKPFCLRIEQQAKENEKWINAIDYYNNDKKRKIIVTCEDNDGSGCIRGQFIRTWPNKKQKDAEYSYVQVSDNAGNSNLEDSYVNASSPCTTTFKNDSCRVLVKVDTTYPKIKIDAYKRDSNGKQTGGSILKSDVTKTLGGTSTKTQPTYNISYNKYNNTVKDWMNKEKYEYGVIYKVTISDNIHLASWKWETNKKNQTTTSTNYNKYGLGSESTSGVVDDSNIDMTRNNCGPRTADDIFIHFVDEGSRKGRLTVTDKAGNETIYYIEARIDRTPPTKPGVNNPKNNTWTNSDVTVTLRSTDNTAGSGIEKFQYASWYDFSSSATTTFRYTYKNEQNTTTSYRACDNAGNCGAQSDNTIIKIDKTAPSISLYHDDGSSTVTDSCTDVGSIQSGIRSHDGSKTIGWGNSGNLTLSCTDNAGNSTSAKRYMQYNYCYYGHPAYWDGGYCAWDPYYYRHSGACHGGYQECFGQGPMYYCPRDVCDVVGHRCCCNWQSCAYRDPDWYTGEWVWSNYCVYHESTCRGGYA